MVYSPITTEHMVAVSTTLYPQLETKHHFWSYQQQSSFSVMLSVTGSLVG
jgi:hypothetical protein